MSPALRRLPDGRIGLLYSHRQSTRVASRRFIAPSDEGATWSEPVIVAEGGYKTGCYDRFTICRNGRLLAPYHGGEDLIRTTAGRGWRVGRRRCLLEIRTPCRDLIVTRSYDSVFQILTLPTTPKGVASSIRKRAFTSIISIIGVTRFLA